VGRQEEMALLRSALDRACRGDGGLIALIGEGGIGKSRVVAEIAAEAAGRGMTVLVGRSYESEQILPFGPWVDAFRTVGVADELRAMPSAWRAELSHLLPELADPDIAGSKSPLDVLKVFEGMTAAIRVLAGSRPLLLGLEDLHWADEMSLRLLAFLGRRLHGEPVLALVTVREEELADAAMLRRVLDELGREGRLSSLSLSALSRDDTLLLVHTLVRSGTDDATLARLGEVA